MARSMSPTVPSNYSERRIISLENFMLSTTLRGKAALAAFNQLQVEQNLRPTAPLIAPDPLGLKLQAYYRRINEEIRMMRGDANYWQHHEVRKG